MRRAKRLYTVLVIDAGGRGAALLHKYSQSQKVKKIIAIPGNDLMHINSKIPIQIFPELKTTSVSEIIEICKKNKVNLIDVAQDNAVEAGLSDRLVQGGFNVVGPSKSAGQIEWDKAWARDFMKKYKLPIPSYSIFNSLPKAEDFINKNPSKKWFIKASGLAEGKGVFPALNKEEAVSAVKQMSKFGKSGKTFIIEEWLEGEEFSMFALCDGNSFKIAGTAQDHKRILNGDQGPNTGGMGCSTPPLIVTKKIYKQAEEIIRKTIKALRKEGRVYKGVLYLGAMVVKGKVFVIEFNARWGSPEAEVLLPGMSEDILDIGMQIARGKLRKGKLKMDRLSRVAVTGSLRHNTEHKQRKIYGLENVLKMKDVIVYGVRVSAKNGKHYASAGRQFHIVGQGENVIEARKKVYEAMSLIFIEGNNLHYRTDIGWRDVKRLYSKK